MAHRLSAFRSGIINLTLFQISVAATACAYAHTRLARTMLTMSTTGACTPRQGPPPDGAPFMTHDVGDDGQLQMWATPVRQAADLEAPRMVHIGNDVVQRNRVYGAAAVASYLAKRINPGTSWSGRMKAHWLSFPEMPFASAAQGGFLEGWDQEAIWA